MDAHRDTAVKGSECKFRRGACVIECVAAFMDDTEHGAGKIVIVVMGGDALIKVRSEIGRERVFRRGQTDMAEIEPYLVHQHIGEFFLFLRGKVTVSDAVIYLRLFFDTLKKRHDTGAEFVEELVAGLHVEAFFVYVQPVIERILVRLYVFGKSLMRIEDLLKIRAEELKIRVFFCSMPYVVGHDEKLLISNVFIRRDLLHVADVLEQKIHHAPLIRTEFVLVSVEELKELYGLFRCALPVDLF